jgi:hypothetical protein
LLPSLFLLASTSASRAAERFDDITVGPQSLASGETYHGYRELRIQLENRSVNATHRVTLIYPDRSYGGGNSISRMSRTVSLGPSSTAIVPMWQPPLAAAGNGNLRVLVDGSEVGRVGLPDPPRHLTHVGAGYGGSMIPATLLVSRSLNYDEVGRALKSERAAFGAAKNATGPRDATRRGLLTSNIWTPDPVASGPHWIELGYDHPLRADHVRIIETLGLTPGGDIVLTGISGTNLARIPINLPVRGAGAIPADTWEFSFPLTPEPVKTVRLEFGSPYGGSIGIDAVELEGAGSGSVWASSARASSEPRTPSPFATGMPVTDTRELLRSELPASEWSEYWLSYTPYDAIVLNSADTDGMPPAVLSALWRYAECGGNLILLGGGEVPEPWRSHSRSTVEGGASYDIGFGQCFVFETSSIATLKASAIKLLLNAASESARRWQSMPDEGTANSEFPVVENFKIPVRGTVLVMLAFVVLIGPVNLIVLSRLNRRTWLLWTIPAISFFTCVVVFGYSLLREGVTPDARTEGLTLLDQGNRRATSQARTAFYCPLTPSQGLFFGFDTEATPLVNMTEYRSGNSRELDWTESQHLERGWVTARVPAQFHLRKSEVRRERLELETSGQQLSVVNGLGASIRSLWLADSRGRIFTATNVGLGQKAVLLLSGNTVHIDSGRNVRAFGSDFVGREIQMTNALALLLPNTYIAELDTNPFIENGLGPKASSARTKSRSIVYGLLEPPRPP